MTWGPKSGSQWSAQTFPTHPQQCSWSLRPQTGWKGKQSLSKVTLFPSTPISQYGLWEISGSCHLTGFPYSAWYLGTHQGAEAPRAWPGAHHAGDLQLRLFLKTVPGDGVDSRWVSLSLNPLPGTQGQYGSLPLWFAGPFQEKVERGSRKRASLG